MKWEAQVSDGGAGHHWPPAGDGPATGTPERRSMTGAMPHDLTKEGQRGSGTFLIKLS